MKFEIKNINRLSRGNKKLSKEIGIWNLPAGSLSSGGSCLNCKFCERTCYAKKAQRLWPKAISFRKLNLEISKNSELFQSIIVGQVRRQDIKVIRIHESGDFYSQKYIENWAKICRILPNVKFYGYSKVMDILDFKPLISLGNVNFINSILPDNSINFGTLEYCKEKQQKFGYPICIATKYPKRKIKCGVHCKKCQNKKYVLFVKH